MILNYTPELHAHLSQKIGVEHKISCVFQGGSALFFCNPHDIDLVVLVDEYDNQTYSSPIGFTQVQFEWEGMLIDCFVWDAKAYMQRFYGKTKPFVVIAFLWAQQYPEHVYFGSLPSIDSDFNWKEVFKNLLLNSYRDMLARRDKAHKLFGIRDVSFVPKSFYWDWLLLCLVENQRLHFSSEQIYAAEMIHNRFPELERVEEWFRFTELWLDKCGIDNI